MGKNIIRPTDLTVLSTKPLRKKSTILPGRDVTVVFLCVLVSYSDSRNLGKLRVLRTRRPLHKSAHWDSENSIEEIKTKERNNSKDNCKGGLNTFILNTVSLYTTKLSKTQLYLQYRRPVITFKAQILWESTTETDFGYRSMPSTSPTSPVLWKLVTILNSLSAVHLPSFLHLTDSGIGRDVIVADYSLFI
mgnify:CR=1 FL=1